MLACREAREREIVAFAGRIAQPADWRDEHPFTAIYAEFGARNGAGSVTRFEMDARRGTVATSRWLRGKPLDHRRRIVDFESLAFALGFQCFEARIRWSVRGQEFEVVRTIGQRTRVPGEIFLVNFILQDFPVAFAFAAII